MGNPTEQYRHYDMTGVEVAGRVGAVIETPDRSVYGGVRVATTMAPNPDGSTTKVVALDIMTSAGGGHDDESVQVFIDVDEKSRNLFFDAFSSPVDEIRTCARVDCDSTDDVDYTGLCRKHHDEWQMGPSPF
jgi:hypothetical protein